MSKPSKRYSKASHGRKPNIGLLLVGTGLILFGIVAFVLLNQQTSAANSGNSTSRLVPAQVEFPAPELSLVDLEGKPVTLSDFRGQVVLLNNWATWCPPCKEEMPTLQAYYKKYQGQGLTIIAIEAGEPASQVAEFVRAYGLSFPVWPDPDMRALASFGNRSLPNSYVIDREGIVRLAWNGAVDLATLEKYVTPLVRGE